MIAIAIICLGIHIQREVTSIMKKYFVSLLVFIFSFMYIYAQEYNEPESITKLEINEYFKEYNLSYTIGKTDGFYTVWNWPSKKGLKISQGQLNVDENGFSYFIVQEKHNTVIYGSNFFFIVDSTLWSTIKCEKIDNIDEYNEKIKELNKDASMQSYFDLLTFDINRILSSSEYSENLKSGKVIYTSKYLNIFLINQIDYSKLLLHAPWVPEKEKSSSGIGEYLEIDFTKPKDNLVVLNGYVDLEKRYLYKANNRVKKAVITSLDKDNPFEIEYVFEDYVHFSEINFPKAVNKVRFTIKEVYKGEKWDDTCITAVITRWEE